MRIKIKASNPTFDTPDAYWISYNGTPFVRMISDALASYFKEDPNIKVFPTKANRTNEPDVDCFTVIYNGISYLIEVGRDTGAGRMLHREDSDLNGKNNAELEPPV